MPKDLRFATSGDPADSAAWFVKCKAVIKQNYSDVELDEVSFAELLLDENAVASMPRPGTSLLLLVVVGILIASMRERMIRECVSKFERSSSNWILTSRKFSTDEWLHGGHEECLGE